LKERLQSAELNFSTEMEQLRSDQNKQDILLLQHLDLLSKERQSLQQQLHDKAFNQHHQDSALPFNQSDTFVTATSSTSSLITSPIKRMLDNYNLLDSSTKSALTTLIINYSDLQKILFSEKGEQKEGSSKQAKLAKYLIKLLKFSEQASKRRSNYSAWVTKIKSILSMFPKTMNVLQQETIIRYTDPNGMENKALFLLISSEADAYFLKAIMIHEGKRDKALEVIKTQCAHIAAADMHHYHYLFTSLQIPTDESATSFFRHFTFAHSASESANNSYSEEELVNFALSRLSYTSSPKYEMVLQLYNLQQERGSSYILANIEEKKL